MRHFGYQYEQELVAGPPFYESPTERVCPACGVLAIRAYVYRSFIRPEPTLISYMWCANCRRASGWTGPDLGCFEFNDPLERLTRDERLEMERGTDGLFERLDQMWEAGELPQRFTVHRKKKKKKK